MMGNRRGLYAELTHCFLALGTTYDDSTEEIGDLQRGNVNSPRNREIKVRKNEMKLRKNDFEVPKNFPIPPWRFGDPHRGIVQFPRRGEIRG